jgi:hypothetical protein
MCYNAYIVKTNEVNNLDRKKTIEIKCKGADTLPIDRIVEFQGELKKLSKENENKLRNSILKHGFIAPFFVWDDHGEWKLLDGHQRLKTLLKMREEGYDIPMLPVDYIEADSEEDAKRKLLHISSQYGEFTTDGFENFTFGLDGFEDIRLTNDEFEIGMFFVEDINAPELDDGDRKPFRQMTFTLHDSQFEIVEQAIKKAKAEGCDTSINDNSNGNALTKIAEAFIG